MRLLMMGVNHRTAPIELREQLAVSPQRCGAVVRSVVDPYDEVEAVVLSTCNRTELYLAKPTSDPPAYEEIRTIFANLGGLTHAQVDEHALYLEQDDAAAHLIGVAAGLDSLALGEPHILGQVRRAYEAANDARAVGYVLHTVFQQTLAGARQIRKEWASLLDPGVSIATLAIDFARQVFETFEDKTVLGIGAGEIGKLTLRTLMRDKPARLYLANRTNAKAQRLIDELALEPGRGKAWPWEQLDAALIEADVVVCATGSSEPILTAKRLKTVMKQRRGRPLFIVDAALPRDVAAQVGSLRNVYLYNIDELEGAADVGQATAAGGGGQRREAQLQRARGQVQGMAAACLAQVQHRDVGRLIRQLRERLHWLGQAEQARTQRKLEASLDPPPATDTLDGSTPQAGGEVQAGGAGEPTASEAGLGQAGEREQAGQGVSAQIAAALDEHTHRLINKILHMPLSRLDQSDPQAPLSFYAAALRELFELDSETPAQAGHRDAEAKAEADPLDVPGTTEAAGLSPPSSDHASANLPTPPHGSDTKHGEPSPCADESDHTAGTNQPTRPRVSKAPHLSKALGLTLAGLTLVNLPACTLPSPPRWVFISRPSAKVARMRITDQTDEGAALRATVMVDNPNDLGLPLKSSRYRLAVADQTLTFTSHPPYALPPKGDQAITLDAAVPTAGEDLHGQPYRLEGWAIYDAPGHLRHILQDLGLPQPRIHFRGQGTLE